ncbi:hypothetical protein PG994_004074 [Apiospora phragmitis]|uniref:BTB domain-containing protein n=1 Tax=Apiospora phragmitis TaxID=2905665 RepID=A0ABR1VSN5_9PEZI
MALKLVDIKTMGDLTLFHTGMFHDTVIHCQGVHWTLHRSILASRCQWFKEQLVAQPRDGYLPTVIRLHQFPSDLVGTLLRFIYTAEIRHPRIGDNRVIATLYNMSIYFKIPKLGEAIVAETGRRARLIVLGRRAAAGVVLHFRKSQLDELFGAVRIAYNGEQA